jgi:MoxR-vWA-beta-propeller ternary system domain bpX2
MKKPHPLDASRAALVPATVLEALAPLRARGGVRVLPGDPAWVTWDSDRPDVIAALVAVPGAELFEPRDGHWFRPGAYLPAFELPPPGEAVPIDRVVLPAAVMPTEPADREQRRVPLRLVRGDVPHATTALRSPIAALTEWVDTATSAEIAAVKAARNGDVAWLLGSRLPALVGVERFWGERVLIPLGFRADPDWPEPALREAAGVGPAEILVLTEQGPEAISAEAFKPLTRAAIRRASGPPLPPLRGERG